MNYRTLTYKSVRHYSRYYKLGAVAIVIAIAVIAGSLLTGNSVRTTLVNRVTERLGTTETIIFPQYGFLTEQFAANPLWGPSARGILLIEGFISVNGRLIPAFVWGVDDMNLQQGQAKINSALANETGLKESETLVLRIPAPGLIPSGSLFVSENYTTSLRLSLTGIVPANKGGNSSLKNEQLIPLNLFMSRKELAEITGVPGKINLVLANKKISVSDLNAGWTGSVSGLQTSPFASFTEMTSDRVFLPENVVTSVCNGNTHTNRLFSYLANSIRKSGESILYSFVTALDSFDGKVLASNEVILSDYSAQRLGTQLGDSIWVRFYQSTFMKNLREDSVMAVVSKIVPIAELQADRTLSANFPGLSNVDRCTDWDSDLPLDMKRITKEDEAYWEKYRSTPKAIISYQAIASKWKNAYGSATSVRVEGDKPNLSILTAEQFGVQLIYPRETGLYAAQNGVDFSSLFLSLGFFIILSATLLLMIPFSEMIFQRKPEFDLLKALGYTPNRIVWILLAESAPVIFASAIGGVILGFVYTALIMWLLGNVWQGATHTEGFAVYLSFRSILIGVASGVILAFVLVYRVISRSMKQKKAVRSAFLRNRLRLWAVVASLLCLFVIILNIILLQSLALFVAAGACLIGTAALWGNYRLAYAGNSPVSGLGTGILKWKTIRFNKKQAFLAFFSLATGVFIVFAVGLNRQSFADPSKITAGTGGYTLWCESSIPVYHDLNSPQGQTKLGLAVLPAGTEILQCLRKQADEASCLNLNKVSTPTILGINMGQFAASDFKIQKSLNNQPREQLFASMSTAVDSVYPVLVDATVLQWSLVKSIGDTLHYGTENGKDIRVQIVGTIDNSVFQGNVLMDRALFASIWPENSGNEVFLIKTGEDETAPTKHLFAQALSEYGVRVSATNDRLRQFNSVTDTYLSIFLSLGGLGLLLGIMAFVIVIRKNLAARKAEIGLYFTLGFSSAKIIDLLYRENLVVPVSALVTGVVASLVAVAPSLQSISFSVWLTASILSVLFLTSILLFIKKIVRREVQAIDHQTGNFVENN